MRKYNRIMEIFWLVVTVVTVFFSTYRVIKVGFSEGYVFLFMPVIAGILFGMRRRMRKKMDNHPTKE